MSHFDELPRRDRSHEIEDEARVVFDARLTEGGCFILQASGRKDYGTDCQVEVIAEGHATNVRVHVQLKGTERALNSDGSLSVEVQRTNLNYLLMQAYSFYACYHLPTRSLRICPADSVLRQYEHGGKPWMEQQTLTVSFIDEMTVERLQQLASLARSGSVSSRDRRIEQTAANPADLPEAILNSVPEVHVPEDRAQAGALLQNLYEKNADEVISAGFDKFAAVLGADNDIMGIAFMSEINLGMASQSRHPCRIEDGIAFFRSRLGGDRSQDGSLHYTVANAFTALRDDEQAKAAYQAALADPAVLATPDLAAQVHMNLGTSFERLGEADRAVEHYSEALRLDPNLPEAHNAMGNHYVRIGCYKDALAHFDQVAFADRNQGRTTAVSAWRANVLFNLGQGQAAFREINSLTSQADRHRWIWPWCRRLVASFGRTTIDNAVQARAFWQRYVQAHPDSSQGRWELLMSNFYLRGHGYDLRKTYAEFKDEFDRHIAHVGADDAALPWDRMGHWAQDEGDWAEAERCFRTAYDLEAGHYGYCLGTALNFLDRFDESLPILLEQAQALQPDATSWFQVGMAYAHLGKADEAIDALQRAAALDPGYALVMFELGGVHWNSGDQAKAKEVWSIAYERFPEHELVSKVRAFLP
jgi:tetratricopeptide (TPR) repeat protein